MKEVIGKGHQAVARCYGLVVDNSSSHELEIDISPGAVTFVYIGDKPKKAKP